MRVLVLAGAALVASCASAEHGPTPFVLAMERPRALAVHGSHLYWVDDDRRAIRRVPISGGAAEELFRAESDISRIAVADDRVVFGVSAGRGDQNPNSVDELAELSLVDRTVRVLAYAGGTVTSIALDGDDVYWASYTGGYDLQPSFGGVYRGSRGQQPQLLTATKVHTAIAIDATHVYVAGALVVRVAKTGGEVQVLGPRNEDGYHRRASSSAAVDGERFYWAGWHGPDTTGSGPDPVYRIYSVAKNGGAATVLADATNPDTGARGPAEPWTLALEGDRVWIRADGFHRGDLWYVPANGGGSPVRYVHLADGPSGLSFSGEYEPPVVVDARFVYWTDDARILRVPR